MKNILIAIVCAAFTFNIHAAVPDPVKTAVHEQIRKEIAYPDFARENHETGVVIVNFTVDNQGKIIVRHAMSNNALLRDYVVKTMETIQIECVGEHCADFSIRINFELL
jgi:hypothetical protein